MPRKESEAVPESNGPVPHQDELGSGQPRMVDVYRMIEELLDKSDRKLDELADEMRGKRQRLASLVRCSAATSCHGGRCREHTEGAAKAVQAMHGDSFSANRVDPDPMYLTSFGVKAECLGQKWRCGAQVVSLTLGDALTNSRRWLTPHRHGLYSYEDRFLPAASMVLPDRRDKSENFNSIRLVLQRFRM